MIRGESAAACRDELIAEDPSQFEFAEPSEGAPVRPQGDRMRIDLAKLASSQLLHLPAPAGIVAGSKDGTVLRGPPPCHHEEAVRLPRYLFVWIDLRANLLRSV